MGHLRPGTVIGKRRSEFPLVIRPGTGQVAASFSPVMFEALQERLEDAFKKLRGHAKISESNITDAMRDIRLALLEADVEFGVVKDLVENVKTAALGAEVLRSVSPGQQIVKIFHDELVKLLGS